MIKWMICTLLFFLACRSYSQVLNLDDCGVDTSSILNDQEIAFFNNVLFNDSIHNFKKGFEFENKKLAFFTCGDEIGDGFLTKDKYFGLIKPIYRGPRGIMVLSSQQKSDVGGYDAIIIINCKAYQDQELLNKLKMH